MSTEVHWAPEVLIGCHWTPSCLSSSNAIAQWITERQCCCDLPAANRSTINNWMRYTQLRSCLHALLLLSMIATCAHGDALHKALAFSEEHTAAFQDDLLSLSAIPTISALAEHSNDIIAAADWLKNKLTVFGMLHAQVVPTDGAHPVVYADWLHAPGNPTILVYGHYDVQPVDPLELWTSPPFEPSFKNGYFHGRGVDDDKGGVLQVLHALECYLATSKALPVNVKLLLEGQEEIGSPNLEAFLRKHRDDLFADVDMALSADGGQISPTQPGISTGMRGAIALQVTVETASIDLHSGVKGGSVQNANHALISLLASLKDAQHKITVPGFYDDVAEMSHEDKADVAQYPYNQAQEQQDLGVLGYSGESGFNALEQRWYRPTLEVVGMWGGFTGEGMKTVIPRKASAKVSCRLVPNMNPTDTADRVKAYLEAATDSLLANVTVEVLGFRAYPWTSPKDTAGNQLAAKVLAGMFDKPPVFYRDGGTIPALTYFQQILGVETTIFAFCLGDHIHAPNERLLASFFHKGREAWVRLLHLMGQDLKAMLAAAPASRDEL